MRIKPEVIDELLKDYKKPEDVLGENGLLKQFTKPLLERALNAELTHHLGYEKHERVAEKGENARNGASEKTLETEQGEMVVQVPRDRNATFEPRRSYANTSGDLRDSTIKSSRCMRGG